MGFEEAYQSFLEYHLENRNAVHRQRLAVGHKQAEKEFLQSVWWPIYYHFNFLHPEYAVNDFKDGTRYLDFAYIRPGMKVCIEIDGYGPHQRDVSRWQFSDNLTRQNQLILDGWIVLRFSYDQLIQEPKQCQQVVQQMIGKLLGEELDHLTLSFAEKEIVKYTMREGQVSPKELCQLMQLSFKPVQKLITGLITKQVLQPHSGKSRVRTYRLAEGIKSPFNNLR